MPIIIPLILHFYARGTVTLNLCGNTAFIRVIAYPPDGRKIRDIHGTITNSGNQK